MKAPHFTPFLSVYFYHPAKSKNHSIFFRNYSYWFLSFSCPCRRNMTYEGFLWLVWALLFLKENFSFFPPISSSLYSKETRTKTKKKEPLTGLVFLRSTSTVKNTLGGFLPLLEKRHRQSSHTLCRDSAHNWIPTATSDKNIFVQQELHHQPKEKGIIWEINKPKSLEHNKQMWLPCSSKLTTQIQLSHTL